MRFSESIAHPESRTQLNQSAALDLAVEKGEVENIQLRVVRSTQPKGSCNRIRALLQARKAPMSNQEIRFQSLIFFSLRLQPPLFLSHLIFPRDSPSMIAETSFAKLTTLHNGEQACPSSIYFGGPPHFIISKVGSTGQLR